MNTVSLAVRLYSGCLSTSASETALEPNHHIEPSLRQGINGQTNDSKLKRKIQEIDLLWKKIKPPPPLLTALFAWLVPPTTLSCRNCRYCFDSSLIRLFVNRLPNQFLATKTELIAYSRILFCTTNKFSYGPSLIGSIMIRILFVCSDTALKDIVLNQT